MRYSRYMESEPAVNFLQFNRDIFGYEEFEGGTPWDGIIDRTRQISVDGQISGLETPGGIISEAWPYVFAIAGLILFSFLVWGALEIQFGAATPKSAESGKQRITNAVIGFVLLFSVFWLGQIIQQIFGLNFGVGQTVPVPGEGPIQGPEPPPATGPLENFSVSAINSGNALRICASSSQNLSEYAATGRATLYENGASSRERNLVFQSGSTSRCMAVQTTASAQNLILQRLAAVYPDIENSGVTWRTEVLVDAENNQTYYTLVPSTPLSLDSEAHQQLWNAVVAVNTSGLSEAVRLDIDAAARTYSIRYRVDGVTNPGN